MLQIHVDDGDFRGWLSRQAAQMRNPRALMAVLGRELANVLKKHFLERDRTPNALGGRRSHFWRDVSKSVNNPEVDSSGLRVSVAISHPIFRHKYTGGTITAKRRRFLTIPVSSEAYGRTAATFKRETRKWLFFLKTAGGGVLATREYGKGFTVHYLLRRSVTQKADTDALPSMFYIAAALKRRAEAFIARQLKR
jgi:hypothetical protein